MSTAPKLGIITGAAGGIGRATAERFVRDGWSLVLVDVADAVEPVATGLAAAGARVRAAVADITRESEFVKIDRAAKLLGGPLKFLGLIAGVLQRVGLIETMDMDEWDRVMSINLRANVMLLRHCIPALRAADGASVVTVSSWFGRSGHGLFGAYCASKAGLISLTQSAAAELARDRIRVNSVAPGNVATGMHFSALREEAARRNVSYDDIKAAEWARIPLGRAAEPSEIAAAIAFLASSDGSYLTGATIDVNGGCLFS